MARRRARISAGALGGALLVLLMLAVWPAHGQESGAQTDTRAEPSDLGPADPATAPRDSQPVPLGDVNQRLSEMSETLDQAPRELRSDLITESRLDHWRQRLPRIRRQAEDIAGAARSRVRSIRPLLETLGPRPEDGSEPAPVANQRDKLNQELSRYVAQQQQAELILARVDGLMTALMGARRTRFAKQLLSRGPTVFTLETWHIAGADLLESTRRAAKALAAVPGQATAAGSWKETLPTNGLVLGLTLIIAWPLRTFLLRRYGRDRRLAEPSYLQRLIAAAVEGTVHALVPALAALAIYGVLAVQGLLHGLADTLALMSTVAFTFFSLVCGLSSAALAPRVPRWRVIDFTDGCALRLQRMIIALAAFFAIDGVIVRLGRELMRSEELAVTHEFLAGLIVAAMILRMLSSGMWERVSKPAEDTGASAQGRPARPEESPDEDPETDADLPEGGGDVVRRFRRILVMLVGLAAIAIPLSAALGYYALARYLSTRLVTTSVLVAAGVLLHGLARELANHALTPDSWLCRRLQRVFAGSPQDINRMRFWLLALLDAALLIAGAILGLSLWGVGWEVLGTWLTSILLGFQIGGITLFPVDLVVAGVVFVAVVALSRALQRVMDHRVFPQTRLDVGVQHSLNAAIGYGGWLVAILLGISALGLDLSNLAIIAGALSVGIGFGLQTIVNNFVSGLILLIERPVKAGDWVVVGAYEGFVKKINVRATELETFDRASVIVPNSDLVSTAVTNWTHKNRQCRLIVKVRVPYGCDTQTVHDLLLRSAREHRALLRWPAPHVLFMDFGESGLVFELRCYARDVDDFLTAPSELRFAIDRRLREAGIAIPHPGRDIYVRTIPWDGQYGESDEAQADVAEPARPGRRQTDRPSEVPEASADANAGE